MSHYHFFSELVIGDRFYYVDSLWTKVDHSCARKHGAESISLGHNGYGYNGDAFCSFKQDDRVQFVPPCP